VESHHLLAYVAWHEEASEIVVAFRGTVFKDKWLTNKIWASTLSTARRRKRKDKATGSNVATDLDETMVHIFNNSAWKGHRGFLTGFQQLKAGVIKALSDERNAHPDAPVIVTGHSLGGALATVAAADLSLNHQDASHRDWENLHVWTFGSPRVFNKAAAEAVSNAVEIHRVVSRGDPVPHFPPCRGCKEGGGGLAQDLINGLNNFFAGGKNKTEYWHVAKEVWQEKTCSYDECSAASKYNECDASGEDPHCSDSVTPDHYHVGDHMDGYLGIVTEKLVDDPVTCPKILRL